MSKCIANLNKTSLKRTKNKDLRIDTSTKQQLEKENKSHPEKKDETR